MIVAKYKFDKSIYENLIPVFNGGYTGYTVSDEIDSENSNHIIRTIECDTLPTMIRFGDPNNVEYLTDKITAKQRALRTIETIDISNITNANHMFCGCAYTTSINFSNNNVNNTNTGMECMFFGCTRLVSLIGLDKWDTSNVTTMRWMFTYCNNLTSIDVSNFNTSKVTDMRAMFDNCVLLTTLDVSNFNTSNVTDMYAMFYSCNNLTSLDVSNFDTSNVNNMSSMFYNCKNLTSLDVSNFDTSNVTNMTNMFNNCKNLTSLDVSNFDTSKVTNFTNIFNNTPKLLDIGMLYCTSSTINTIASALPTTYTQTIWVQDTDINKLTSVSGVEFKEYKENSVMINLSSPLLDGDRIEVVDGKLCHYHKMGSVVLNGSEGWNLAPLTAQLAGTDINTMVFRVSDKSLGVNINRNTRKSKSNNFMLSKSLNLDKELLLIGSQWWTVDSHTVIRIRRDKLSTQDINGLKQWLQQNPTIAVYELAEPYYEDITPMQSDVVLETYLECNLDIYTKLPIKTNVSYITNVPSLSTLSMRATEMKESDNILANLTDKLDNEINE